MEHLEQKGYHITRPRREVVQAILRMPAHFTAEDLQRRLPSVGRATIFRTIRLLTKLDVVCRVLLEEGRLHYSLTHRGRHHHHLLCVQCEQMVEFADCDVNPLVEELTARSGYTIHGHRLEVYGLCQRCGSSGGT